MECDKGHGRLYCARKVHSQPIDQLSEHSWLGYESRVSTKTLRERESDTV